MKEPHSCYVQQESVPNWVGKALLTDSSSHSPPLFPVRVPHRERIENRQIPIVSAPKSRFPGRNANSSDLLIHKCASPCNRKLR